MEALEAELTIVPSVGGKVTPDLVPRMMAEAESIATEQSSYQTNHLHNADAIVGYRTVGRTTPPTSIDRRVLRRSRDRRSGDGCVWGIAGGGSDARVVIFEPAATPFLSTGVAGTHGIEGIGIGSRPPLLDDELYDEVRPIDESEARTMARRLASEEGLLAGPHLGSTWSGRSAPQPNSEKGTRL